jgi:hypothetical protein
MYFSVKLQKLQGEAYRRHKELQGKIPNAIYSAMLPIPQHNRKEHCKD